ncbi:hypothetical protein [Herbaspirillum sp. YR522]|uniref:hypothetical protein n=1 Tax=Herbaspirillum sp. YR522 TaxID=1144342 RepID=UPI001EE6907F|nr:hypothetical protein [Herbaspirillum sp. YR522]
MQSISKRIIPLKLLAIFFIVGLNGCDTHQPGEGSKMKEHVELRLNQSGDDLLKKYPGRFSVSKHPTGLNFYVADWNSDARGSVVIGQPDHAVTLPYILGATGSDDSNFPDEHIIHWEVTAGIADGSPIGHDEARQRFFSILQSLRNAGWVRATDISEPRLNGKDALNYRQTRASVYSLDTNYVLSLQEWMSLRSRTTWSLYSDHAYLDVSITRDPSKNDVTKPGAYFLEYSLQSQNEYWRSVVGSSKRLNWKSELPAVVAKGLISRKSKEDELKKSHIPIDEAYRDPPVPQLGPQSNQ